MPQFQTKVPSRQEAPSELDTTYELSHLRTFPDPLLLRTCHSHSRLYPQCSCVRQNHHFKVSGLNIFSNYEWLYFVVETIAYPHCHMNNLSLYNVTLVEYSQMSNCWNPLHTPLMSHQYLIYQKIYSTKLLYHTCLVLWLITSLRWLIVQWLFKQKFLVRYNFLSFYIPKITHSHLHLLRDTQHPLQISSEQIWPSHPQIKSPIPKCGCL